MTIYTSVFKSTSHKKIFYLSNVVSNDVEWLIALLPFEFNNHSDAAQVAADMSTQHDFDSVKNNDSKENRSTITLIPGAYFNESLLNEILEFSNHRLSNTTYIAARLFLNFENEIHPFFGTIKHNKGKWEFLHKVIEKNVLAYEHFEEIVPNKMMIQTPNSDIN